MCCCLLFVGVVVHTLTPAIKSHNQAPGSQDRLQSLWSGGKNTEEGQNKKRNKKTKIGTRILVPHIYPKQVVHPPRKKKKVKVTARARHLVQLEATVDEPFIMSDGSDAT